MIQNGSTFIFDEKKNNIFPKKRGDFFHFKDFQVDHVGEFPTLPKEWKHDAGKITLEHKWQVDQETTCFLDVKVCCDTTSPPCLV